jgi:hypothetical protein
MNSLYMRYPYSFFHVYEVLRLVFWLTTNVFVLNFRYIWPQVQFGMNYIYMVLYILLCNLYMMWVSEEMYIDYPKVDDEEGNSDIWWAVK